MQLDAKMTVGDLLTVFPSALDVFVKRKMLCVGCVADTFHTIEDVARIYDVVLEQLLEDLRQAIDAQAVS